MKLIILDKESQEPALELTQDERGLAVSGGDARLVQALKLNQFKDLKEISDYLNSDPNGVYEARMDDEQEEEDRQPSPEEALNARMKPALDVLKDLMSRVKNRQDQDEAKKEADKPESQMLQFTDSQIMQEPGGMLYITFDGDNIGNAVARAERKDDEKELAQMSAKINAGQTLFNEWAKQNGGYVVEQGGDEGLAKVPNKALKAIEEFRTNYFNLTGATCSVGIGKKISEATDARMLAKLKGKNRSEMFTEATRKELKIRLDEKGDPESKKIALALDPADVDGAQPVHTEESLTDQGQQAPAQAAEQQPEMQKPPGDVVVHEPDETPPSGNDGYDDFGYRSGL